MQLIWQEIITFLYEAQWNSGDGGTNLSNGVVIQGIQVSILQYQC
jgi:hypothetical protein